MKQTEGYFIIDQDTNKFVCLDRASGGYPYMADSIIPAHKFNKLDDAVSYRTSFHTQYPNWKIVIVEITTIEIM